MENLNKETIMLAFVAVTALAVLMQAIILLAILVSLRKAARSIKEQVEDLRSSVMPVIYNTREFMTRFAELYEKIAPKIEASAADLAELTQGLRVHTAQIQTSTLEVLERVRRQSSRVDGMVTSVLDAVDRAGGFIAEVVSKPVRQISGMLASIKAIVESLSKPPGDGRPAPRSASQDKDMFV